MLAGIRHFVRENLQDIIESSYMNCHAKGVHSLMLLDYPGKSIRMFYASRDHDLARNADVAISRLPKGVAKPLSVAFHPHRRNLTLEVIAGKLTNVQAFEDPNCPYPFLLDKFEYKSQIVDGKMGFSKVASNVKMSIREPTVLYKDAHVFLPSTDIHTVVVDQGQMCAWLVYEGAEDATYNSVCYSNANLERISSDGLYQQPTEQEVKTIFGELGLL